MIYEFFKTPNYQLKQDKSFKDSLKDLFNTLLIAFFFLFINYILVSSLDFVIKNITNFSFFKAINNAQKNASYDRNIFFFLITAPLIEELIFRLPLIANKFNIFLSIIFAYYLFYFSPNFSTAISGTYEVIRFLIFCLLSLGVLYRLERGFVISFINKHYRVYFYTITIVFGLLHISNFISLVPENLIIFAPIFVIHQIIVGFFLGYIRLRQGLAWSILLHFLFNLLPTISYFLKK